MRILAAVIVCVLLSVPTFAQRGTPPPPTDRTKATHVSAAEIAARIAKLPKDRANSSVRVFTLPPYNVNIEHRQPMAQGASVHEATSELFYVLEGSATMLTGGKIVGETGKTIEGGVAQKFAPGDWLMVPSGVPHQFVDIKSPITILSLHLPDVK
ncbi:MAG: cupin domain-containing protein [Acidobacteria bacterium]|nr:MAG: cupin domain-containing protein [Acidobacteriota bacterium]